MSFLERHVAVLPFPFSSHPWPLAKLALRLAAAAPSVHFSFLSTAKSNLAVFTPHARSQLPINFTIYSIDNDEPSPKETNPPTIADLRDEMEFLFNTAPRKYETTLDLAARDVGIRVDCLFTDAFTPSAYDIATKKNAKWIVFWVPAPYSLSPHIHKDVIRRFIRNGSGEVQFEKKIDIIPGLSIMKASDLPIEMFQDVEDSCANNLAKLGQWLPTAAGVVMNSYEEANPRAITTDLKNKFQNLLYVGCPAVSFTELSGFVPDPTGCISWLNQQSPNSVLYISFGTVLALSSKEISALAEALEECKTSYLWSLQDHQKNLLPAGFVERTGSHGKLVSWTPQTRVLSHASVGAYLSHAGYNSLIESIVGEVPMICRPFWADNPMNARMVEDEWEVGVIVEEGIITKNGLVKCLERVLGEGEEREKMKKNIRVLKNVLVEASGPNGNAMKDFNTLVELIAA